MTKQVIINAYYEVQFPQYVKVDGIEYPAPDEVEDYEGTAPQYWITVDERNISALRAWCEKNTLIYEAFDDTHWRFMRPE